MTDLTVANEIQSQIGNKAFKMMGAMNLVGDETSLTFKIRGCSKISHIKVELDSMDTYNITYIKCKKFDSKVVATSECIYADMMHDDFEANTGLAMRLF